MKNKIKLWTEALTLLPLFAGLLLWEHLPSKMPTHFNLAGEADGFSSKAFAVLVLPFIFFFIHKICVFLVEKEPENKKNIKIKKIVYYICPAFSVLSLGLIYARSLGFDVPVSKTVFFFAGLLFIVTGNYLPKCQSNSTMGIRLKWTLRDGENWRKTHRMAGKVWIAGGILIMVSSLADFKASFVFLIATALIVIIPILYSYSLYKKTGT